MELGSVLQRLRTSFVNSAGTIVFGMEDGTVSIFGLIFGVAATTTDPKTVLIAGASGAAAAAVSMMAGTYLDVETHAMRPRQSGRCTPRRTPSRRCPTASGKPVSRLSNPKPSPVPCRTTPKPSPGCCLRWGWIRNRAKPLGAGAVDAGCGFSRGRNPDPAFCPSPDPAGEDCVLRRHDRLAHCAGAG